MNLGRCETVRDSGVDGGQAGWLEWDDDVGSRPDDIWSGDARV